MGPGRAACPGAAAWVLGRAVDPGKVAGLGRAVGPVKTAGPARAACPGAAAAWIWAGHWQLPTAVATGGSMAGQACRVMVRIAWDALALGPGLRILGRGIGS